MPSLDNQSKNDPEPKVNGYEIEIQETTTTQRKFKPEDFSQLAINRGQRQINYELTDAAQKLSEALRLLTEVLVKASCVKDGDLVKVNKVIAEAAAISRTVAGIDPPGCEPVPPPPPPPLRKEIEE